MALSAALNTRTEGSGSETVVFGHGFGTDQSIWDKVVAILAENHRVVLFDWPFSGTVKDEKYLYDPVKYSTLEAFGDDLITLMSELDLKAATFVGHSMSAMIGCIASIKRPDLFKRLVLVAASPRYLNSDDYEGGFSSPDIEQILLNMGTNYENWVSGFASMAVDPNDKVSFDKFEKGLKRMGAEVGMSLVKTVFYADYRDMLHKVETPCTIIQTTHDLAVPRSVALYMANAIKGQVALENIDTIGHFPQLTAPLKLVEVIIKGAVGSLTQIQQ